MGSIGRGLGGQLVHLAPVPVVIAAPIGTITGAAGEVGGGVPTIIWLEEDSEHALCVSHALDFRYIACPVAQLFTALQMNFE